MATSTKIPEKTRHEIFTHWVQTDNYAETGRHFHCSDNTVKNIVKAMPEYYAREHEHQRRQFIQEAWLLARKALRELDKKLPGGDLKDVAVAFGIISQRATNAMYAAQKTGMTGLFVHNQQQINQNVITGDEIARAMRDYEKQIENGKTDGPVEADWTEEP